MIFPTRTKHRKTRTALSLLFVWMLALPAFTQPANDVPCSAVTLTVGAAGSCSYTTGTTVAATQSVILAPPPSGCANASAGTHDVWYKFVIPASGNFHARMDTLTQKSAGMALYETGAGCFPVVWTPGLKDCDENDGINGMPMLMGTGMVVGSTVYLRIWEPGNNAKGTFKICVTDPVNPGGTTCTPVPDSCSIACNLGKLLPPAYCDGDANQGTAITSSYSLTNVGSTAANPYLYMGGCTPSGMMASPAKDVWYKFTASAPKLAVTITGMTTPTVALWDGSCGNLSGLGCAIGSAGSLSNTFEGLADNEEYFLQISGGNSTDAAAFTLTLSSQVNCATCLQNATLVANPAPSSGVYPPNTSVTFTLTVDKWKENGNNFLHGVEIIHEIGWNLTTLTDVPPSPSCNGAGIWDYYTGTVTGSKSGNTFGPGFFYDANSGGGTVNGNPGDNFGDQFVNCAQLVFQWTITTENYSCVGPNDLAIFINTTGDGESGSFDSTTSCINDPELTFTGAVSCVFPIDLLFIHAEKGSQGNIISWATATELINDYYVVERSLDGDNFQEIGTHDGNGTSGERHDYVFIDPFAHSGTVWYRVHQIDLNGYGEYTDFVAVQPDGNEAFIHRIFPNPAEDKIFASLVIPAEGSFLFQILDLTGRLLSSTQHELLMGTHELSGDVSHLPSGQYLLRIRNVSNGSTILQKFVK